MNVKFEKKEKNVVELEIEVEAAKFEEALQKSYKKNVKSFNVPGFRVGKAPRNIIEGHYGEGVFFEDAVNFILDETYGEAVKESNIEPVDKPEVDVKQIEKGKNFIYTAKVTVKPSVELGEYKGVEVEKEQIIVTEEDLDNEINKVREKNGRIITIEDRQVQTGDIAVIDFEGFVDGKAFEGGKGENYSLTIGSGQFIPGFEEQLIATSIGDEVEVDVTFPENYDVDSGLAGKKAMFKVKIREIKLKELPILDDEFAKDVSEFDTLEEYKSDIMNKLKKDAENKEKGKIQEKVIEKIVENAKTEIPEVMIKKQIDKIIYDIDMSLRYQGMNIEKYMEMTGTSYADFSKQFEGRAKKEVKTHLVLEKITKLENLDVTEAEIKEEIKRIAGMYDEYDTFESKLNPEQLDYIRSSIEVKKVVDMLVESARIA